MELLYFSLRKLRNEEHYQFMESFDRLLDNLDLAELNLETFYSAFKAAKLKECASIERLRGLATNQRISEANQVRSALYRTIVLSVRSNLTISTEKTLLESARTVEQYLKHYGNLSKRIMSEKDATFNNFVKDLQEKCPAQLTALGLTGKVADLKQATQKVEALMDTRLSQQGALREQQTMTEARAVLDECYLVLKKHLDALLVLDKTTDYSAFKSSFNSLVLFHKQMLSLRSSTKKKETVEFKKA